MKRTSSRFGPGRSAAVASKRYLRCMLAVSPSGTPLSSMAATVSSPSQTRSVRPGTGAQSNFASYATSVRPIQPSSDSLSPSYGSGMRPAASRSVCTQPGTVAGTLAGAPSSARCRVQRARDKSINVSPEWGQPLRAPSTMPLVKYRWKIRKNATVGSDASRPPARIIPSLAPPT